MASVEYLNNRVIGKEKELAKLEKKMERIKAAEATGWEKNPYYYDERDLASTEREIQKVKLQLEKYKNDLETQMDKENSRNVKPILEFLDNWYEINYKFYMEEKTNYDVAAIEFAAIRSQYMAYVNDFGASYIKRIGSEEFQAKEKEYKDIKTKFEKRWGHVIQFIYGRDYETELVKELKREYNRKYDYIIEKTVEITGEITDASYLTTDAKGNLNGYITGKKSRASVSTISAGGYNIQCFHFRTLIKEI